MEESLPLPLLEVPIDDAHGLKGKLQIARSWLDHLESHASWLWLHTLDADLLLDLVAAGLPDLELQLEVVEAVLDLVPIEDPAHELPALQACIRFEPNLAFRIHHCTVLLDNEMEHGGHCTTCIDGVLLPFDVCRSACK